MLKTEHLTLRFGGLVANNDVNVTIEDGKITSPVKSFTVAGNFFDWLKQITDVDNELDFGGPGSTRICAPDVLVPDMPVAGE